MSVTQIRTNVLAKARRIVIKLGTQVLTGTSSGQLDLQYIRSMARQIARLHERGVEVTVVSSGAIGAGCAELGLDQRPQYLADQQAVAAVGQRRLMSHMHKAFDVHGLPVGQVLLTRGDFDDRVRFLNIRNCIMRLHKLGCIPILNENDTVSVDELRFGDNDLLAALVCNAMCADTLVLLTVVDGLLDGRGNKIDLVENIDHVRSLATQDITKLGSGGMAAKLDAAQLVTNAGEVAVILNGRERNALLRLFDGKPLGTIFVSANRKLSGRRRWIGLTARPAGTITVDNGASSALLKHAKSLLASGIVSVSGRFEQGQAVLIRNAEGHEIARGLCNYTADEVRKIMGKRSNQFQKILGRPAFSTVIHRDNLVLLH